MYGARIRVVFHNSHYIKHLDVEGKPESFCLPGHLIHRTFDMQKQIAGIHHVTAIAGDPQRNIDFYAGVLGLRLVKFTVNYDDPGTYHLYYGDYSGQPGTILTFFPWRGVPQGRAGVGQVTVTSFSVPADSFPFWEKRLTLNGVEFTGPESRFDETLLSFRDPDGMQLELVASQQPDSRPGWPGGPIPDDAAIRGFHGAAFSVGRYNHTTSLLSNVMGFREVGVDGNRHRFATGQGGPHSIVDVIETPADRRGLQGAGSVHHIAWRAANDEQQLQWLHDIRQAHLQISPVIDRTYFHSIYYREPSGILFEIATDPPGFTVDEPLESLGASLVLPAWLEPDRARLLQVLPPLKREAVQHA